MVEFEPLPGAPYRHDYEAIFADIAAGRISAVPTYRDLAKQDLFFLLYFGLARQDVNHPWIVSRIRDVEECSANSLDLWAREHYKSTILTFARSIQEVINNPEHRIGIFSHTRPVAKGFLRQIKQALETDPPVLRWFPDIFYHKPRSMAPKWSEDDGLIVKRAGTYNAATWEAWGLVDGMPTGKHFSIRIYDDVVTESSVTTPDMIRKTVTAYELSQSLGTHDGIKRVVGTHYHYADLYAVLRERPDYTVRIHPATHDGTPYGDPVFVSRQRLDELIREQGPYVFACQQLLDPVAGSAQVFLTSWIKTWPVTRWDNLNIYILVDPASEKKRDNDYTVMMVVGLGADRNYYVIDMLRDRLNLRERADKLIRLVRQYQPISVGYEKYGMQADIEYLNERMDQDNYHFELVSLAGNIPKADRIRKLIPLFSNARIWLPGQLHYTDYEQKTHDLVQTFIREEYRLFPASPHDDMLDCLARVRDPDFRIQFPSRDNELPWRPGDLSDSADDYDPLTYEMRLRAR